jgi:hypothetical protein
MIAYLGGAGAGFVCGWLFGMRASPRRLWSATAATAASLVFAGEALVLAGWWAAASLLAAVPAGLLVYAGWRAVLRARYLHEGTKGSFRA